MLCHYGPSSSPSRPTVQGALHKHAAVQPNRFGAETDSTTDSSTKSSKIYVVFGLHACLVVIKEALVLPYHCTQPFLMPKFIMVNHLSHGATLAEANQILADGGFIRFVWAEHLPAYLVKADGELRILDGRTYDSLRNHKDLIRTETGSTEDKNLVIEWRQR